MDNLPVSSEVVIIGAGPAGLTAAFELGRYGRKSVVLESEQQVGGISKTVVRDGWRFDLGGHRFFTKVPRVERFWHEILPDEEFLLRPRMSRIYYNSRFFDYPLKASNALKNLGVVEAVRCVASYLVVRVFRPKDQEWFEGWVAARFGWRLYRIFFKTYTEKVWGIPATTIRADWAAQRIKNLSLGKAIMQALFPWISKRRVVTSLIEQFQYPRLGPGLMWERCAEKVTGKGSEVRLGAEATRISRESSGRIRVDVSDGSYFEAGQVISTMPINRLIQVLSPEPPQDVVRAAMSLKHRDFLTVALVVPEESGFPDNWIYIHTPDVRVGRIQNFGSWSPHMVKPGFTCLGLEYFVNKGDELWSMADEDLIGLARQEISKLGLCDQSKIEQGYVVRVPMAYPVYDDSYSQSLVIIRTFLDESWPEIFPVGRNGMHRYNNQDHSMLTAMLTVDKIMGLVTQDVWLVNVDEDYHEEEAS